MSMISEQVKELRDGSDVYKVGGFPEVSKLLKNAADTIEALSAKLQAANMERSEEDSKTERLTKRTDGGILVKEDYGEDVLKTLYQCYGAEPMPHYANCDEGYCAMEKLAQYEDLVEQNRLIKLPCKAGQKVFLLRKDIKSVIDGEITSIRIGEFASGMKIFIIDDNRYTEASFDKIGDVVFFTREEAEAAFKELERGKGE